MCRGVLVGVVLAQVVTREGARTTGVLLFHVAQQVGAVANLGLNFLLAVTEVVVGHYGDDYAALVTGAALEGLAVVVEVALFLPAHAVATLTLGGLVPVGQA